MNYRHEFHAGNLADVFKHVFLSRALLHLGAKPMPFRTIETHAGSGIYDLLGPEGRKEGGTGRRERQAHGVASRSGGAAAHPDLYSNRGAIDSGRAAALW